MRNDRVFILRESVVKITQMLSGKGIRVTQQGVNAYVKANHLGEPVVVNLPYLPDNATEELCQAIQGFLDHEVAHILFTEFPLMGKANAQGRQIGFLLNALEDPRIEKEMAKRFQGSAYNLAITGKFYLDKFVVPRLAEKAKEGDANGVVNALMVPMLRAMSGQQVFQEFMKDHWSKVDSVYSRIKDLDERIENASSTKECFEIAIEIGKRLKGEKGGKQGDEGEDSDEGARSKGKGKPSDEKSKGKGKGKGTSAGKQSDEDETDDDAKGENADAGDGEGEGEGGEKPKDEKKDKSEPKDEGEESDEEGEDEGEGAGSDEDGEDEGDIGEEEESDDPYNLNGAEASDDGDAESESDKLGEAPIWAELDKDGANGFDESMSRVISDSALRAAQNSDYLPFTKDYDLIEKLPIGSAYSPKMTQSLVDKVDHMVGPLQKDLERAIAAKSLATRSHGHRSGRLHAANLSRLAVGDARVFSRKHESTSKDVAVELVVDCSGSMGGSKIHTACQAAYALSSVLDRLQIKNEVIGFTTKDIGNAYYDIGKVSSDTGVRFSRMEGLYMPILKGYDERIQSSNVKERFGWLPNTNILRSNVDGECVEIAARRLMARKEAGKIMIVLSDGYPAAAGSRGDLEQHLKRTVEDIGRSGVKVVGIGIESDAVKKFYPKSIVLNNVTQLPGAVIKELRHLLMQ